MRALIVEDSPADVELAVSELRRSGLAVEARVAGSEQELRPLLAGGYDVVLSDYRLPGFTGMDAFRLLKQQQADPPPFILITGTLGEEAVVECLKEGIADCVLKTRLARLPLAVRRALQETATVRAQREAEQALRRAQEELEERVRQRTAQLTAANAALLESEQRFRLLTEDMPVFVWTANPQGGVDFCNQRWLDYSGLSRDETEAWGWQKAVHPDDLELTLERWKLCLRTGETFEREQRFRRASDGAFRWHLVRAVPLRGADGVILRWFGTGTDIHEQNLAQQAQERLVAMREDLVANVSHALRTPLASMRGFSELLLTREFSEAKRREFLTVMRNESARLAELINRFLDLQRMQSGHEAFNFGPVDLAALLEERGAFFAAPDAAHPVRLDLEIPLPRVNADLERLREVVNNLISNAMKYSPGGGEIVIGARSQGGETIFWIADRGLGIPEAAMPHLFSKFYRVASGGNIAGTGLGLAMVKQVVELHHGRVWAESVYGQGSTFYVALPRQNQGPVMSRQTGAPGSQSDTEAAILLVEDDAAFAQLLCEHFEERGHNIRHTAFAEEALQWCLAAPPRVVLLDIHLAGAMDGWDLLLAIKNNPRLSHIAVVVMAASDPNTHGLALRGVDYVLKSASSEELGLALRRQLPVMEGKNVLLADDDPVFRARLTKLLRGRGAAVTAAHHGAEMLRQMEQHIPDLVVLDLLMPEFDGFEVLRRLRSDRRAVNLRILVVTAKELHPGEKTYLTRRLASLVEKSDTNLAEFAEVVDRMLASQEETAPVI